MAVHLLEGHKVGGLRTRKIIDQREKLLALGTITAGLTHQLNNPAGANARAVADLRDRVGKMRHKLAMLADGKFTPEALRRCWSASRTRSPSRWPSPSRQELSALETSDREDQIGDWLEDHGIVGAWDYPSTFVEAGLDIDWLERISASVDDVDASASLQGAIGWLKYTIETEQLMNEIGEASKRISGLLAGAKQYSQMDRAPYQSADVHELLRSTLMMFGDKVGKDKPIKLVQGTGQVAARIAVLPRRSQPGVDQHHRQRHPGHGRPRHADGAHLANRRRHDPVEICDDGPGISEETSSTASSPRSSPPSRSARAPASASTWPGGSSSRSTTAISGWSRKPGDTRFIVVLPLVAPRPAEAAIPTE